MTVDGTMIIQGSGEDGRVDVATEVARSGPPAVAIPLPGLGTVEISRPELAYVAGIVGLTAFGLMEWPVALVIAGGHVLAADRGAKTLRDLGRALGRAEQPA